jgi:Domain of unknown function (DUF4202)
MLGKATCERRYKALEMDSARFAAAILAFDRANGEDPNLERAGDQQRPRELVHAERLSAWVLRIEPDASEALRLAARCQHLRRWEIPRSNYASGRVGYLKWRTELGRFHADAAQRILETVGYEPNVIEQVRRINLKQGLHSNADTQTMEDALCLEFIENELEAFLARYPEDKILEILQKTWKKMSPRGHAHAQTLALRLSAEAKGVLERALTEPVGARSHASGTPRG